MTGTVTAADLAEMLGWPGKRLRARLRAEVEAGNLLMASRKPGERWSFTEKQAAALVIAFAAEPAAAPMRAAKYDGHAVADSLVTTTPIAAEDLEFRTVPDAPGLYAWWHKPGLLGGVLHEDCGPIPNGALELAYIGISTSLRRRSKQHLGSSTGRSTLRRVLGGWIGESEGLRTQHRAGRLQYAPESEQGLTSWMKTHLWLTWVEHPEPDRVESAVIALLAPPLNHMHNRAHPNWPRVIAARTMWRPQTPDARQS
jgi:hypothetical protein